MRIEIKDNSEKIVFTHNCEDSEIEIVLLRATIKYIKESMVQPNEKQPNEESNGSYRWD